jgi:thioesterase DpgC
VLQVPNSECAEDALLDLSALPSLSGQPESDAAILRTFVKPADDESPGKTRSLNERRRRLRYLFVEMHAEWLYDKLTAERKSYKRLSDLAYDAAVFVPGLLPTKQRVEAEAAMPRSEKDGCALDQALFLSKILRSPVYGGHLIDGMRRPTTRALTLLESFCETAEIDLGSVYLRRVANVAHITLNNTYCLNAEDNKLTEDLETAVDLALLDTKVDVGVLRGAPMTHPRYAGRRVFCAGINLKHLHAGRISFLDFLMTRELGYINKIVRGLFIEETGAVFGDARFEKPWIAAVDSFAIGGGVQLVLVCDKLIAAADSYLSLPAAHEGIVPGVANLRLPIAVGARLARQMILFGRKIWANQPEARALIDNVVEPTDMDRAIEDGVRALSSGSVAANRRLINSFEVPPETFREYMAEFAVAQAMRLYSADVNDHTGAFLSKSATGSS